MQFWKKNYLRFTAIAAINLGFFIAYRIYMHKNFITPLKIKDFKPFHMLSCLSLDFEEYPKELATLNFEKFDDDLDELNIACFKYQNILFSIQKYTHSPAHHYTVFVDIKDCHRERKDPQDIVLKALKSLNLNKIPVSWINMQLGSSFKLFEHYRKS